MSYQKYVFAQNIFICIESTLFFTKPGMDVVYFKHMISSLAILSQLNWKIIGSKI